jgi:hypothetical protein
MRAFAKASVHVPAALEPSGTYRNDGKRPDGVTLMAWSKGKCLLWEAACSHTLAKSYISSTSRSAGAAALSAEKRKHKKYEGVANLYKFVPFAVATLGPFGEEALDLIKDLGRRLIESSGELKSRAYLTQRISIPIHRAMELVFSQPFLLQSKAPKPTDNNLRLIISSGHCFYFQLQLPSNPIMTTNLYQRLSHLFPTRHEAKGIFRLIRIEYIQFSGVV